MNLRTRGIWASFVVAATMMASACAPTTPAAAPTASSPTTAPAATTAATAAPAAANPAASPVAASAPTSAPAAAKPAASPAAAAGPVDTTPFRLGNNSTPDQSYLPTYMALDAMKKAGYNVQDTVTFRSDTLALQALASNETQIMTGAIPAATNAVSQNLPIKVISARTNNTWSLVATKDITDCNQLNGKSVGIFSDAGVSTAFLKIYLQTNCPNAKPNYLIIADSPLRRQALEAGQLVATPLEPGDSSDIVLKSPDKFRVLANFSETNPDIGRDVITTNATMLRDHPTVVRAFIKAQLEAIRQLYADPSSIARLDAQYLQLGEAAPRIGKFFLDNKVYCANGGLADPNIAHTLDVFGNQYKLVPTTVSVDQLVDQTQMNSVLAEIGRSPATSC